MLLLILVIDTWTEFVIGWNVPELTSILVAELQAMLDLLKVKLYRYLSPQHVYLSKQMSSGNLHVYLSYTV